MSASAAAASFRSVLSQLMANEMVYRWLTVYPVDVAAALQEGALLIACPHKGHW